MEAMAAALLKPLSEPINTIIPPARFHDARMVPEVVRCANTSGRLGRVCPCVDTEFVTVGLFTVVACRRCHAVIGRLV
jgi:hypothetical protein